MPGHCVDQPAQTRLDVRRILLGGFRECQGIRRRLVELGPRDRAVGHRRRVAWRTSGSLLALDSLRTLLSGHAGLTLLTRDSLLALDTLRTVSSRLALLARPP